MGKYWYRHQCCICGRFSKWDADSSTPFGNSYDMEPPEPEFYCDRCVEKQKQYYIETGWLPTNWIPAEWEFEVAIEQRKWRAGPRGAGWGGWHPIDKPLPDDYTWRTISGWEEHTPNVLS